MISICMATYNGSIYIERQLRSILCQIASTDEVILVDDHSTDATLGIVGAMGDQRIKVYRNQSNQGIVRTFERAISLASGEVIFLSDQDDIWHPEKVARFLEAFNRHPEVTLVLSDATIIDEGDEVMAKSFLESRGGFSSGLWHNIIKNKYLGCTMAFRRSLVDKILPFPKNIPMHDVWIGCVNSIYGTCAFLDIPLMGYRRHTNNATPTYRRGFIKILIGRWHLVNSLGLRLIKNKAA